MKPKKSLGQNFLTSIPARNAIVEAGHVTPQDTILEIGPGKGVLTESLLTTGAHMLALEKDKELIPYLCERFATYIENKKLTLIEGDVLTYEPPYAPYKIIANIPYYITGAILERYLSHERKPIQMVVLIQKEVAERIVARDGKESILSIAVKAYGTPKIVYRVDKGSFFPRPKVDSAVLCIDNISSSNFIHESHELMFFTLVKAGFAHKRKVLISNLRGTFPDIDFVTLFEKCSIDTKTRAEDVTLQTWISLSRLLS